MPWISKSDLIKHIISTNNKLNPFKLELLIATYPKRLMQSDKNDIIFGLYDDYKPIYEYLID